MRQVRVTVAPKSDGTGELRVLVEVDVDLARTPPRAVHFIIVPVIGPAAPMVGVVAVATTMPVAIAIRLAVVPDEALEETSEAALARAAALIAIEDFEQVVEHRGSLSTLRPGTQSPGRIQTDEPGSGQARLRLATGAGAGVRTD
jgi:hypothetical protein